MDENGDFDNTDNSKDPIIAFYQANARKIAAMAPVVDLESRRENACEPRL